jgi:hypothetical protein
MSRGFVYIRDQTDLQITDVCVDTTNWATCLLAAFDVSGVGLSGSAILTHFGVTGPFDRY